MKIQTDPLPGRQDNETGASSRPVTGRAVRGDDVHAQMHACARLVAAVVGGVTTVVSLELGAGALSVMIGALAGVVAGALTDGDETVQRKSER